MNNIFITGSCGYVGKALFSELKSINLSSLDRDYNDYISRKCHKFFCDDLNAMSPEAEDFLSNFAGSIIHLAAARSDDFSEKTYKIDNLKATENFIKKLNPKKIKLFIHLGSVAAIDGEIIEQTGNAVSCADDWYRITKYQQQKLIESWSITNNVPLVILAPSAIHDSNARDNLTNIGRLEKAVSFFKIMPEINVLKSLTAMSNLISAIKYFINPKEESAEHKKINLVRRYLVLDKPVMTITEICKKKFKAKLVVKIPKLKSLLLLLASLINFIGLQKKMPLSKDRVMKLYKSTDYNNIKGYKEWLNEKN